MAKVACLKTFETCKLLDVRTTLRT
jgi:hypothetical protein